MSAKNLHKAELGWNGQEDNEVRKTELLQVRSSTVSHKGPAELLAFLASLVQCYRKREYWHILCFQCSILL